MGITIADRFNFKMAGEIECFGFDLFITIDLHCLELVPLPLIVAIPHIEA